MLDTKYDFKKTENGRYEWWNNKGYFNCDLDSKKEPFSIILPPPNVTGNLHIGHAWDVSIQDIVARYKRMDGYDVLWLPGTDHAAIATETKVIKKLRGQGINKYDLGREKFVDECYKWSYEYMDNIHKQWAVMGIGLDYTKERFTLDKYSIDAVNKVFIDMYNKGLIYRGKKIINWDPVNKTSLSNEEVIYKDIKGAFYHIKYYLEDKSDYLEVATTRPETLFGDTAVAVNPKDKRYTKYIGKNVILPIVNKLIPVVADEHADPNEGTGVVKITPAHDPNDFEVGNRHNLERIVIMDESAHMNENAGTYKGLDRFECRDKLVEDLKKQDLLISIEEMVHSVGHSERTDAIVEPYLSEQWFVKMEPLSNMVLEYQHDKSKKVNFFPKRFDKIMNQKASDCYDWCISRQLWWGIRIPIWYKGSEIKASVESPGEGWVQDPDVLDTWFSSALWPFSTLNWIGDDPLYKRYFPTSFLVAGYDIIFFWVFRMYFQSINVTGNIPFKDCYVHGLIRAKDGRKMSKSLGNGVEPIEMVDKYGCDALRYYLTTSSALGLDLKFDEEKLSSTWNFINKIWNASRFTIMNTENIKDIKLDNLSKEDKWILTKLNKTIKLVRKNMEKYEFQNAGTALYDFIWSDFCDSYIEFSKFNMDKDSTKSTLIYVLDAILKMLHPFMPFVTEELYQSLPIKDSESIMISSYPKYDKKLVFEDELTKVESIINFVKVFRNVKQENNIPKDFKVKFDFEPDLMIIKLLKLEDKIIDNSLSSKEYKVISNNLTASIYYEKEETEKDKKAKEDLINSLKQSIERREKLLSNENYINKAPKNIVDMDKAKLEEEKNKLKELLK